MNKIDDGKRTLTAMIFNVIAVIFQIIVSLVVTICITRVISTDDLGIATSFTTLKNILTIICLLAINVSINRLLVDVKDDVYEYLSSVYLVSSAFCIFVYIVYIIFNPFFNKLLGFDFNMMSLMFSFVFLINACTLMAAYWNFKNYYKFSFIYNILANPIGQILSLTFAFLLVKNKYLGRIVGIDFFNILFGIVCGIYILYKGKFKINKKYVVDSLKISVPMIPHLIAQLLLTSCDLLMIKNISGASNAGIYSMGYTIAVLLYAVLIQFFNPWSPWVYRRLKENEIEIIYDNSKKMMVFCFYLCIGLICITPDIIHLLLVDSYYPAIPLVGPIAIGIFFQVMYIFFFDIEYYYKKNKQIALFSVITSVLNIILNYIFINKVGYQAAAFTTLISYFVLLILHYFGMRRVDKRKIYDIKLLAVLSIMLIVLLMTLMLSNNNLFLRYSVLIITTCVVIKVYKDFIKRLLNNFLRRNV